MKKLLLLAAFLGLAGGAAFLAQQGLIPGFENDSLTLKKKSFRFLECLKFKEFGEAARFHTLEELKAHPDIPKKLERFFLIPPENLDVQQIDIDFVELDSTGRRARVKTTTSVNVLNKNEKRRAEAILYWKRVGDQWFLDLRTTLERGGGI